MAKVQTLRQKFGQLRFFCREVRQWLRLRQVVGRGSRGRFGQASGRCLIVPCDPWSVIGSRGDQAMMLAAVRTIREENPETTFSVLTCACAPMEALRGMGLQPEPHWDDGTLWTWAADHLTAYDRVCLLGADVTDGVYGWNTALRLQALYDVFDCAGCRTLYFGFSFSEHPHPWMRWVFALQRRGLPLPVRDPVSYRRLCRFTRHRPVKLVADVAFCMAPRVTPRVEREAAWCDGQRAGGHQVMAVNLHQMFNGEVAHGAAWEAAVASVLTRLLDTRATLSLLFLPHDDRPGISDNEILCRLAKAIPARLQARIHLVEEVFDADEAKALLAHCDMLMAGRMHLSIAALGQRIPVFALVYQGKFEGLWEHFGLGPETLCPPERFLADPDGVLSDLSAFVGNHGCHRETIRLALPKVLALSSGQFDRSGK